MPRGGAKHFHFPRGGGALLKTVEKHWPTPTGFSVALCAFFSWRFNTSSVGGRLVRRARKQTIIIETCVAMRECDTFEHPKHTFKDVYIDFSLEIVAWMRSFPCSAKTTHLEGGRKCISANRPRGRMSKKNGTGSKTEPGGIPYESCAVLENKWIAETETSVNAVW